MIKPMATSKRRKYRTITGIYGYRYGIYDNGRAVIQTNGVRFRVVWDDVVWNGNTGGHKTQTEYLDRAAGRKRLRAVRREQAMRLRGDWPGGTILDVITGYIW